MIKRIIRWEAGGIQFARGYIFGGCNWSFAAYAELASEAKKDFPLLTDERIEVHKTVKSGDYRLKRQVVSFPLEPTQSHRDYEERDYWDFELA